jgi:hypothetical protein
MPSTEDIVPSILTSPARPLQPDLSDEEPMPPDGFESNNLYERLLDKVITASKTAIFPTQNPFSMASLLQALPTNASPESSRSAEFSGAFGIRSENQMQHDMKIGAAGELFVSDKILCLAVNCYLSTNHVI